jgi:hypothetical protein
MNKNQTVRFTLIDHSNEQNPMQLSKELVYNQDQVMQQAVRDLVVRITVGDYIAYATTTLPFGMLSQAMLELTSEHQKQKSKGLVGFDKPGIVGLN